MIEFGTYNNQTDLEATIRIFKEVGWVDGKQAEKGVKIFIRGQQALVARINGECESFAGSMAGTIRYLAQKALARAKERIDSHASDLDLSRAEMSIKRALTRLKVGKRTQA